MENALQKVKTIFLTYRQIILYLFFGVCTTVLNTVSYWLLYDIISLSNIFSTVIAWLFAVIFAFITNKVYVFERKSASLSACLREIGTFFGCRILTGVLDVVIMAVAVDMMCWSGLLWKLISNIIVTIINYIASKFLIFKNSV